MCKYNKLSINIYFESFVEQDITSLYLPLFLTTFWVYKAITNHNGGIMVIDVGSCLYTYWRFRHLLVYSKSFEHFAYQSFCDWNIYVSYKELLLREAVGMPDSFKSKSVIKKKRRKSLKLNKYLSYNYDVCLLYVMHWHQYYHSSLLYSKPCCIRMLNFCVSYKPAYFCILCY